jgi:hypothetical protein
MEISIKDSVAEPVIHRCKTRKTGLRIGSSTIEEQNLRRAEKQRKQRRVCTQVAVLFEPKDNFRDETYRGTLLLLMRAGSAYLTAPTSSLNAL